MDDPRIDLTVTLARHLGDEVRLFDDLNGKRLSEANDVGQTAIGPYRRTVPRDAAATMRPFVSGVKPFPASRGWPG